MADSQEQSISSMESDEPQPGMILTTSDTISLNSLARDDFDSWSISHNIPLVLTKGRGQIGTAIRYQYIPYSSALPSHPLDAPDKPSRQLTFLTVYDLHDVQWIESDDFKSVVKQNNGPYRDAVFRHAEFDTRSYVHRTVVGDDDYSGDPNQKPPPASVILTIMLSHSPDGGSSDEDMHEWFENDHLPYFSRIAGYRTSRLSQFQKRSLVRRAKESEEGAPEWLVVHEFDAMRIPGIGFRDAEAEMARLTADVEGLQWRGGEGDEKKQKGEVEFAFWSLMGEYWSRDE